MKEERSGNQSRKIQEQQGRFKKFVRYPEGAEMYSMGLSSFTKLAREAKAVYKKGNIVLVNINIVDEYLETFREP
ncbi:DUF6462 family protein [Lacrimispora amygdalina]|uniref:DUF6462 family protein n=1 Tax=Lacrimispora amygdalina TaxID=253257 RepID=UPI001A9A6963|nr:DUF6462 family protein [Lacrimispora amygdalina]